MRLRLVFVGLAVGQALPACTYSALPLSSTPAGADAAADAGSGDGCNGAGCGDAGAPSLNFDPLAHAFGATQVGTPTAAVIFTLANRGAVAASGCAAPAISGDAAADFAIVLDTCGAAELAPGTSCAVTVRARPLTAGEKRGTITRACVIGGTVTTTTDGLTAIGEVATAPAWVGAAPTTGYFTPGPTGGGTGDGHVVEPGGIYVDPAGFLYVSTRGPTNRVLKFDLTEKRYVGWIGAVGATPTGGWSGCTGVVSGDVTPGWCVGGASVGSRADGGFDGPRHITGDGVYLYVSNGDGGSVQRVEAGSGASAGWIGRVAVTPTGGATGCDAAAAHTQTPGWCRGGFAEPAATDGVVDGSLGLPGQGMGPAGLWLDGSYLYVANPAVGRVQRYDRATGMFAGWIGAIGAATPSGCVDPTNTVSSTWCQGGRSASPPIGISSLDGALSEPFDVTGADQYLYVADVEVIHRFDRATGAFAGWLGAAGSTKPTGTAATCASAAWGAFTGAWCFGGSAWYGRSTDGTIGYARGIQSDGTHLYLTASYFDDFNGVERYSLAGAFAGWVGGVDLTPADGVSPTCGAGAPGAVTPGWCAGGSGQGGVADGMLLGPTAMTVAGTTLFVADTKNHRVATFDAGTGAFTGHIGQVVAPAAWATSGLPAFGISPDYVIDTPRAVGVDAGFIYVADDWNSRVLRFDLWSGASRGWVGTVRLPPTGGAPGCAAAIPGDDTPGWCTGGAAEIGGSTGGAGGWGTVGVLADGGSVFVATYQDNRILKFDAPTGAYIGWIGWLDYGNLPSGGAPGCTAPTTLSTPGWCRGGGSSYGLGDGGVATPWLTGFAADGTYLYVANDNGRITRHVAASGAFAGWVGAVATVDGLAGIGGTVGCEALAPGDVTPGWCVGGTAQLGAADGMFDSPYGLSLAGGYLYVADHWNARVVRYDVASGAYRGFIGTVETTPTGGAAGCTSTDAGAFTPGWCFGGTSQYWDLRPGFDWVNGVFVDGSDLFVTDSANTIQKLTLAGDAVTFVGWRGRVAEPPTGGDPGCTAAAVGELTPGWCTGGAVDGGYGSVEPVGALSDVGLMSGDANYLYVADAGNHRVLRFPR
ncbi:MAG: choice-of-anchor D domain-containing protein [Deltaproteobacteria bacterium]|nr:choice-of-anchor D domain-containing protein [Deltaproteobacteria bacterium]